MKAATMGTKLGYPQHLQFLTYLDCKKRTKKQVDLPNDDNRTSDDEKLVRFLLENSSITEREGERSFHRVSEAVEIMCKQLCPGQWCTRSHCQHYCSHRAYNCGKTRPKVCKEYAKYIAGVEERKNRRFLILSTATNEYVGCCGAEYRSGWQQKLVRCYGNCEGCEELSNKQLKQTK